MEFKCGLIGLGRIGCGFDDKPNLHSINTHAGAYSTSKRAKLVALCDIDEAKLTKYGKKYGVQKLYKSYSEMFKNEKLDCVSICTLADSHLPIVEEAAKYNIKGIFLEKPISDELVDATKIVDICKENKIKLQIDHQRRFDPFYQKIKNIINDKEFGKIQHVSIYYGGGILNTCIHIFDLLRFFFGEVIWVEGRISTNSSNNTLDPNIDGIITCKNDVRCILQGFNLKNYGILELDIFGEKQRLRLNLMNSTVEYFVVFHSDQSLVYDELTPKQYSFPASVDAIVLGLENLFDSIENDVELHCKGDDGRAALKVVKSMMDSADKNGNRVMIY